MEKRSKAKAPGFNPEYALGVHDDDCERLTLGTLLMKQSALEQVRDILVPECFYVDKHRDVYQAILNVADRGEEPGIVLVYGELQRMRSGVQPFELADIGRNESLSDIYPYAARLHDLHKRRKFYQLGHYLIKAGSCEEEDIVDVQQKAKEGIDGIFRESPGGISTLYDSLECLHKIMADNLAGTNGLTGTPTGFSRLDGKGGLQKSDLIVIAGETSQGKTSFALTLAVNATAQGAKIACYSMEMRKEQLAARIVAGQCGVSSSDILYKPLTDGELQAVDRAVGALCGENLFFDDRSTSNIDTILASIRSMKIKHDIDGAIVDYLQILNVNARSDSSREQIMGDVARRLKNLAKDLDIWVIALSQLNRNAAQPFPTINRLRDSGQIAEAADTVMLVYRPQYYNEHYGMNLRFPAPFEQVDVRGVALVDVAKGRNIGTMRFLCRFDARLTRFQDVADYRELETVTEAKEEEPF